MRFAALYNFWLLLLLPLLGAFFTWAVLARRKALLRFARWPLAEKLTRDLSRSREFWKYIFLVLGSANIICISLRSLTGSICTIPVVSFLSKPHARLLGFLKELRLLLSLK